MKFLSKVKLSNRRYKTPEGYLVCVDSIIARTGKQEYLKSEIFQDSKDDSVIQIDRPKSEVLSPSTIASFENKPLVDEHPDEDVNVDNYRDYAIGFARDVRGSKLNDVDILIANLIFTDPEAIAEIESGEKTELSCGYDCDILGEGDNLYQANIRGNHIALCKAGRAGIARIQDSKMKDSKIKLSRQNALDIFEDIEDDIHWYNSRYNCRFDLNDDYLIIEGNRKNLENIIKEYRLSDYNVKIIDSCTFKETQEVVDSGYSEKLKDLSPEERSKKIDELIADEIEAIDGYKEAMKYADEADKSIYSSIIAEELKHIIELKALKNENFKELKDSNIKDIDFKYLSEEAKKLKEELNLYKRQIGSHKSTNEREYSPRQNQKNNEYVKELNESINQAIKFLSEGNYNKQAWIRLTLNLESWKGEPELENICKKAENAIKKFTKYINEKNNMLNVDSYEKVTKDEENKKMKDGALRGIHLKKIRNTLRNEDEDLVEDFLDYMDTRPDLVKEYDDYSDYIVREDFETWKKYKKIKTRDVDTYEEVTEDLKKELKDSSLKNEILKVGQRVHLDPERNKRLDFKLLKDEYEVVGFKYKGKTVKDDPTIDNPDVRNVSTIVIKSKSTGEIFYINRFQLKDSKIKDSKKYTITFWVRVPGNTTYKDTLEINYLEEFDKYLDKYGIGTDYAFIDSVTSKNGLDFDGHLRKWTDVRKELYRRVLRLDSKVKDKLENKPINILIKFDSSKEANDALKSLQRKEKFMNSKLVANDTIKVMTTDIDYEELKNMLKLYFIKNIKTIDSKVNNSEKLLNIIKLYKKVTKDSKLKDVNYEKIVEKVLDENEIYLDDVDYVEDTNRGVEILCTSYYAQLKVKRILEKAFGRVKSANYRTIILAHEDIK